MDPDNKLNGKVHSFAAAFRDVIVDATQEAVEPLHDELKRLHETDDAILDELKGVEERLNKRIDTTNDNMQTQFAQLRSDVASDIKVAVDASEENLSKRLRKYIQT